VSAAHGVPATVRLYDRLFTVPDPNSVDDFMQVLNPDSLETVDAILEPTLAEAAVGDAVQFERLGYFCPDSEDHSIEHPVFNRIVTLRDSWAKIEKQAMASS
jgi:glutaminyl-tRNA synthetase